MLFLWLTGCSLMTLDYTHCETDADCEEAFDDYLVCNDEGYCMEPDTGWWDTGEEWDTGDEDRFAPTASLMGWAYHWVGLVIEEFMTPPVSPNEVCEGELCECTE